VRSPLLSPNRSCAGCHPYGDDEIKARVLAIQDRHFALLTRAGQAAVAMIDAIVAVRKPYDDKNRAGATAKAKETLEKQEAFQKLGKEEQEKKLAAEVRANLLTAWRAVVEKTPAVKELEELQRAAQWRLDFVAAENSMGPHAPQEMARILGESIDMSRQAEVKAALLAGGVNRG
jgi:nitrite reductase (cytochrome c-552)